MADKNPEVLACDASIMKNVWEIRLREYGQKLKLEEERMEKSALARINEDWAKRMSGKVKPRRVERKVMPPEESPAQIFKPKPASLGRPNGFVSSRPQKPVDVKKDTEKRNKLTLLLNLNEKQPGMMVWTKSWKSSQPLLQPEQMPPASDWGQSWKFRNIQPNNEGKSWMEGEHDTNNNITLDGDLIPWEKVDKALFSQSFEENMAIPDWEKSWKYTKQRKESHGQRDFIQEKLYMFHQSHYYNEEQSVCEWNESWKSSKPPKDDHIMFVSESVSKEGNDKQEEEEPSTIPWGQSWKHFKKQLHMKSKSTKTSTSPAWVDGWRISKPVSQVSQPEFIQNISEPQMNMPEEPLDPKAYQTIMDSSKAEKYMLWSSQFQTKDLPLPVTEWQKSWMTIKNLSEYKEQPMEKLRDEKPKLPIQGQEIQKAGSDGPKQSFGVLPFSKKCKSLDMTEFSMHKDKESFISRWKDSWKALKNQRRQDRILSRQHRISQQSAAAIASTSLNEWANSWRFTNLIANQNSDLWQQGWSTYSQNRPDRWVRENQTVNEGLSHNGPTWARGWAESWRSTRHQHRAEKEATHATHPPTQPVDTMSHRIEQSLSDWDESWQFSTNQFHHGRPSATEWAGSWRFCNFHCENWREPQSEPKQCQLKSMEIISRQEPPCPLHGFRRSIESQIFKERFPPQEWKNSWKMFDEPKPGFPHPTGKEFLQSWDNSWKLSMSQFYQSESMGSSPIHNHSMANVVQYESMSEWGSLWKIANPQPPKSIALWSESEQSTCSPKCMVFWSRYKCNNYLCHPLAKDYARNWSNAWRFMKLESKIDMKSVITSQVKCEDDSVIMKKVIQRKKHLYSQTNKEAPQEKRWVDACKLAKTQPRPKRDVRHKPGQEDDEGDKAMFAEWAESWRFISDSKSDEPVKMAVSLANWEDSWKFFLTPYAPLNGPKKAKGRS